MQQFVFVRQRLFLELLNAFRRRFFRAQLLNLNPPVIPVQFLAHFPDAPHQVALSRFGRPHSRPGAHQYFRQAARLGHFDVTKRFLRAARPFIAHQAQLDQAFVNLQTIFHERNFQFFAAQAAAQSF